MIGTMSVAEAQYNTVSNVQAAFDVIATALHLTQYLFQQDTVNDKFYYDYIVVGAGTAGCVVASRLSEDPNNNVLLIEAGGDPPLETILPGTILFSETSKNDWNYKIKPNDYTFQCQLNSTGTLFLGKMLGGTSSLSIEIYQRGHPHDFDYWAEYLKDPSWKWKNVLPLFKKSEKLADDAIANSPDRVFHGFDGNFVVSKDSRNDELYNFLKAFKEVGNNIVIDLTGNRTLGYTKPLLTIGYGYRSSSASAFLTPIIKRKNLHVLKNTLVTKILFDSNKKARAVQVITSNDRTLIIGAKKEIIVSAGAVKSPQLLMLSGIGPKKHLKKMGIRPIVDLPVGYNLQDHVSVIMIHSLRKASKILPYNPHMYTAPVITGRVSLNERQDHFDYTTINYILTDSSILFLTDFCVFYYRYQFDICQNIYDKGKNKQILFTLISIPHPKSRGTVTLRSTDPKASPIIDVGYFTNDDDLKTMVRCMKNYLKISNSTYFKTFKAELMDPTCPRCKGKHGDVFWRCYALCMMKPMSHLGGTCAMGAVVDSRLKVYGVKGLRVADASVMPSITSEDTVAPTIMIGEKASRVIKEDSKYYN